MPLAHAGSLGATGLLAFLAAHALIYILVETTITHHVTSHALWAELSTATEGHVGMAEAVARVSSTRKQPPQLGKDAPEESATSDVTAKDSSLVEVAVQAPQADAGAHGAGDDGAQPRRGPGSLVTDLARQLARRRKCDACVDVVIN